MMIAGIVSPAQGATVGLIQQCAPPPPIWIFVSKVAHVVQDLRTVLSCFAVLQRSVIYQGALRRLILALQQRMTMNAAWQLEGSLKRIVVSSMVVPVVVPPVVLVPLVRCPVVPVAVRLGRGVLHLLLQGRRCV